MTARAKRTAAAHRRWRDQALCLLYDADREAIESGEAFDVPKVRAHCELILALGRRHRDPDALAVLSDWREWTGGTLPLAAFPRPRGGRNLDGYLPPVEDTPQTRWAEGDPLAHRGRSLSAPQRCPF